MTSYNKRRVGSYPYANVLFSMTCALFMIGLISLFAFYANKLTGIMQNAVEVQVVLSKGQDKEQLESVKANLTSLPFIDKESAIRFVSKEDAAKRVLEETGEDFMNLLEDNPLRDIFIVRVKREFLVNGSLKQVAADLRKVKGVHEIIYTQQIIQEINRNVQRISSILGLMAIAFIITSVVLINNAIKLALFSQRFLIRSMQLVGATSLFIEKPFLIRSLLQGLSGGLIAFVMLIGFQYGLGKTWPELNDLVNYPFTALVGAGLMLSGIAIGCLSVHFAVNRYLKMKLDELY
ncbi:permease-like cell division protein FtsX [Limibacter armeniacum]|uniref:cell division protein FtsX n=1 Tax=Limibacter armeniacum TaxID=466084 RepID=UPI002FE67B23